MASFRRYLSQEFLGLLGPREPLGLLLAEMPEIGGTDHSALDVHFRDDDCVKIYHGHVSLLAIRYKRGAVYGEAPDHFRNTDGYDTVTKEWLAQPGPLMEFASLARQYLVAAIDAAPLSDYANGTEGYWQNHLSRIFGRDWCPGMDWLVIDRESILRFDNATEKSQLLGPISERYLGIRDTLQTENPDVWGKPKSRDSLGNELDFLVLGPDDELICVELKYGSNTSGIYWGPLQVSAYRDQFEQSLALFRGVIEPKDRLAINDQTTFATPTDMTR